MSKGFQTRNHAAYRLNYHLVLVIKYRHKCITSEMLDRLTEIMRRTLASWDCILLEMSGEADHVHVVFEAHPSLNLARLVGNLKTVSSRHIRKEFEDHLQSFFWKPYFWSKSYCIVTAGGGSLEVLKRYLEQQAKPE